MLMGEIKTRDGGSADCAFRGGMLDIVANFPPDKRDAALQQLVDKMLVKQPRLQRNREVTTYGTPAGLSMLMR
jgi:hypothetical protein